MSEDHEEVCQRCGEKGEDRRTLWHACMYAMGELGLPFEEARVHGQLCRATGTEQTTGYFKYTHTVYEKPKGDAHDFDFFLLRCCKNCRSDWMAAIQNWFNNPPAREESTGTGVWVRDRGTNRELTEEEVKARWPDGGEVRMLPDA